MKTGERRQFGVLYRDFLYRIIDLDVLTARGEIHKLLVQFAAMLSAFNFVVAIYQVQRFGLGGFTRAQLKAAAWSDEDFLIATTMAIAGLTVILSWNALLPDRRDRMVLVPLPLRLRTIFLAKVAAIASALGIAIVAVNILTGICYPFLLVDSHGSLLHAGRAFCAYWITTACAGLFVLFALLTIQAIGSVFLRISSLLQLVSLFVILTIYFLAVPFSSNWFLGLFQLLNGTSNPASSELAGKALWSLIVSLQLAALTYAVAWRRGFYRILEQPDLVPSRRFRFTAWLIARIFSEPLDRAIVLFTARTAMRSRQHRLLLAVYAGIGFAIALVYARDLVDARSKWYELNVPMLAGSLVLLFFAVIGTRAVFSLPIALPANWILRIAVARGPSHLLFRCAQIAIRYIRCSVMAGYCDRLSHNLAYWPRFGTHRAPRRRNTIGRAGSPSIPKTPICLFLSSRARESPRQIGRLRNRFLIPRRPGSCHRVLGHASSRPICHPVRDSCFCGRLSARPQQTILKLAFERDSVRRSGGGRPGNSKHGRVSGIVVSAHLKMSSPVVEVRSGEGGRNKGRACRPAH